MKPYEYLQVALETLEGGWCKGNQAQDDGGNEVYVDDDDAVAWCMTGSLRRAFVTEPDFPVQGHWDWLSHDLARDTLESVCRDDGHESIEAANDDPLTDYDDVRHWMRVAIEELGGAPSW